MSKKTLQERFIEALTNRGEREVKRTHKRIVFSRTNRLKTDKTAGKSFYYLGAAGSLRVGSTSAGSIPVSDLFKEYLLETVGGRDFGEWRAARNAAKAPTAAPTEKKED